MSPLSLKSRVKFFQGNSDDLDALHDQIAHWIDSTNVMPTHFVASPHFQPASQPGEEKWFILVSIIYVQPPPAGTQIAIPRLQFTQPPAD